MPIRPKFVSETQICRKVAGNRDCRWEFRLHALERMAEFNPPLTQPDVQNALMFGQVIYAEEKSDVLWRVRGPDLDGGMIKVVAAVFRDEVRIKVVTTF